MERFNPFQFESAIFFKPDDPGDEAQTKDEPIASEVGSEPGDLIFIPTTDPPPNPELIL